MLSINIVPAAAELESILQGLLYEPSKITALVLEGTVLPDQLAELLQELEVVPNHKKLVGNVQLTVRKPTELYAVTVFVAEESVTLT